jgi:hypothetical protein
MGLAGGGVTGTGLGDPVPLDATVPELDGVLGAEDVALDAGVVVLDAGVVVLDADAVPVVTPAERSITPTLGDTNVPELAAAALDGLAP